MAAAPPLQRSRRRRLSRSAVATQTDPLLLPADTIVMIASQMDLPDLLQFCAVNSRWAQLCHQNSFWTNLTQAQFGSRLLANPIILPPPVSLEALSQRYSARQVHYIFWSLNRLLRLVQFLVAGSSSVQYSIANDFGSLKLKRDKDEQLLDLHQYGESANEETCATFFHPSTWHGGTCKQLNLHRLDAEQVLTAVQRATAALFWQIIGKEGDEEEKEYSKRYMGLGFTLRKHRQESILPFKHDEPYLVAAFLRQFEIAQRDAAHNDAEFMRYGLEPGEVLYGIQYVVEQWDGVLWRHIDMVGNEYAVRIFVNAKKNGLEATLPDSGYIILREDDRRNSFFKVKLKQADRKFTYMEEIQKALGIRWVSVDDMYLFETTKKLQEVLLQLCDILVDNAPLMEDPSWLRLRLISTVVVTSWGADLSLTISTA